MRTKLMLAILTLGSALPCSAQEPVKPAEKPITVAFVLLPSRHMLMDVKVNGKGPYKLIFDTGAPINLLSTTLAKDAGLIKKRGGGGLGIFGGMNQIDVDKFEVGGVTAEKLPSVVMDHPTVRAISDAFEDEFGRIDGIVGFPFFARYATTVDYQKKELVLKPTDYKPGDYMADLTRNLMAADKQNKPKIVGAAGLWGFAVEKTRGDDGAGVVVKDVFADGPASAAGLKAGDRILTLDGRWTDTVGDAYLAASLVKPGRSAALVVKRDGKEVTMKVTPTKGY